MPAVYRFPAFFAVVAFISWTVLRVALWWHHCPKDAQVRDSLLTFAAGLHIDLVMALAAPVFLIGFSALIASLAWLPLGPVKLLVSGKVRRFPLWRVLFRIAVTLTCMMAVFLLISEWYFFDEFESRFNTVAIDYLLYTHEVFTNIWESYPVPAIIATCLCVGGGISRVAFRSFPPDWRGCPGMRRMVITLLWPAVALAAFFTIRPAETGFSKQRVLNELANNGWASAIRAAWSRNLDFDAFYVSLPRAQAFHRVRVMLEEPGAVFAGPEAPPEPRPDAQGMVDPAAERQWLKAARLSVTRNIAGDASRPRPNVCILLEESLGSEFLGCLGRKDKKGNPHTLTPELDRLVQEEGMLFTNILADGNRTIRGFEGVFSSFPPLPGDSILARDKTERVETIARVLKRDGYQSLFLYGGRGTFDYITSYTQPNGWDGLVEEKHFENPTHKTAWGVCDEDLYNRGIGEMRRMHATGQPFLASFMTVSNHRPYTCPPNRVPDLPGENARACVVRYADWALGDFFRKVKAEPFWRDTIFVVVADHGARVYGSQTIPLQSYRIPVIIAGPYAVPTARRVEVPGCQLDVAPTIMGMIGRPYQSLFFGQDLLKPGAAERSRSLMHHNRSIAIYRNGRQVVFGLNKTVEYWQGEAAAGRMERVSGENEEFLELQQHGAAIFTVADTLYTNCHFILE